MANVRTNLLARGSKTGAYWNTVYTCPTNTTTIVKHLQITNGAAVLAGFVIYGDSAGATVTLLQTSLAASSSTGLNVYWVLRPGDRLINRQDAGATFSWWYSGSQLLGVAPHPPQAPLAAATLPGLEDPPPIPDAGGPLDVGF